MNNVEFTKFRCIISLVAGIGCLILGHSAVAGTISFFTDRAAWKTAATTAGLTVTTEDFSAPPSAFSGITVGGINFGAGGGPLPVYDAANGRIGYTVNCGESCGGVVLNLDFAAGAGLFGFGLETGTVGNLRALDLDGASLTPTGSGFIGLLGTVEFDLTNPIGPSPLLGANEFFTSGFSDQVFFDNLSVATNLSAVPIFAALPLLLTGLAGLGLTGWRRRKAP